jgi:dephospho-CoA kinase
MRIIGLTGGFGTGKTFAASIFGHLGARVIDADKIAHKAIAKGGSAYKRIVAGFGKDVLDRRGNIDRAKLAKIVFAKKSELKKLNAIVHPEAIRSIKDSIKRSGRNDIVVIDAPLLIEAGLAGIVDKLVVVTATKKNQIERCSKKLKIGREEILKRISNQMPMKKKKALADFVVDNDGTRSETREQVSKVWRKMVWK